jgi:hypothetical protein
MLRLRQVSGENNDCFYRSVFYSLRKDREALEALGVDPGANEARAVAQLRGFVACAVMLSPKARRIVDAACEMQKHTDVTGMYPFVTHATEEERYRSVARAIRSSPVMASELEYRVLRDRLCDMFLPPIVDIDMIVLTRHTHKSLEDHADTWRTDLTAALKCCGASRVFVIVNEDNVHYSYVQWVTAGGCVIEKSRLVELLDEEDEDD